MHLVQTLLLGSLQQLCEETHHRFSTLSTIPGNDEDDSKRYELGLIHNLKCFFFTFLHFGILLQGNCQKPDIEAYGPPARPGFQMNIMLMARTMMMLIATAKSIVMAMVMVNGGKFQKLAHGHPTL